MRRNPTKQAVKKRIFGFLAENKLMSLGTASDNKPWSATVFFAYTPNLELLFYSREDTRHCRHIARNPNVSLVINHSWRKGPIRSLQIAGKARRIAPRETKKYYALYKKRFPWADKFASDHVLYKIQPTEIHYIDEKLFGHFFRVKI